MNLSFKNLFLTSTFLILFTSAFSQKVAHLSLDSIINKMTETKTAKEMIDKLRKDLETESINMQSEFDNKVKDFQEKENSYSESVKQNKITELQQLQARVEDFKNKAYGEIQKKYGELTGPLLAKAKKAIEAVAKENNYKYVLDTSQGSILFSEESDDISAAVLKKLESMPVVDIGKKEPAKTPVKTTPVKSTPGKTTPAKGK